MTKHDDKTIRLAAELKCGRQSHSEMLFRLGVLCLFVLMFIALLLVDGSFSKITSSGRVTIRSSLTPAGFDVTATGGVSSSYTADDRAVLYAFTVTNNSDVDITYDMDFEIDISIVHGDSSDISALKFILVDVDEDSSNTDINLEALISEVNPKESKATISYSTETSGNAFFLSHGGTTTVVLVADYSDDSCYSNEDVKITISGTIDITANQAKEAS